MKSRWCELKEEAVRLRRKGSSIRTIEGRLGIPKSTLSGWFKNVCISKFHKKRLSKKCKQALIKARKKAVLWHKQQKEERIKNARSQALETLKSIDEGSLAIQELALAILYLGEGRKTAEETSLGSSDPLILKFFLFALKRLYRIDVDRISCALYLRADQDGEKLKKFWAAELGLPLSAFKQVYNDKRTVGSKTYKSYKGVCSIRYGDIAIKRKLLMLSQIFCERVTQM